MSPELIEFLSDWLAWARGGAGSDLKFSRGCGLCWGCSKKLSRELRRILMEEFGTKSEYPFGKTNYHDRAFNRTQHEDLRRLDWVEKKLEEEAR